MKARYGNSTVVFASVFNSFALRLSSNFVRSLTFVLPVSKIDLLTT